MVNGGDDVYTVEQGVEVGIRERGRESERELKRNRRK